MNRIAGPALEGWPVGWFAPNYKYLLEAWSDLARLLAPAVARKNETQRRIELATGGVLEFWSLEDPDSGRSRKYKHIIIDEAAKARHLKVAWTYAIRATLADYRGSADLLSTPRGRGFFWELYTRGEQGDDPEWRSFRMPTAANPFIPPSEIEELRLQLPERVFRQEILAEFLDDAGGVFRKVREAIDAGRVECDPPRPGDSYSTGVDLARIQDFTVICVLDGAGRQAYFERFNQISWERQIEAIRAVSRAYPGPVTVDSTGLGDPICEALRKAGVRVIPYHLNNATKGAAVDRLALGLERGRLRLMDIPAQTNELIAFEYELTPSRNVRMGAPEGMHDDCVIALALACWGAERHAHIAETEAGRLAREAAEAAARDAAQDAWLQPDNPALWGDDDD